MILGVRFGNPDGSVRRVFSRPGASGTGASIPDTTAMTSRRVT